jgi:hypothetical protein
MRRLEQALGQRLRGDHLTPRGDDQSFELPEQPARVPVGRDDDGSGFELGGVRHPATFDDLGAGLGSAQREPPHEACRLERGIGRVADRRGKTT